MKRVKFKSRMSPTERMDAEDLIAQVRQRTQARRLAVSGLAQPHQVTKHAVAGLTRAAVPVSKVTMVTSVVSAIHKLAAAGLYDEAITLAGSGAASAVIDIAHDNTITVIPRWDD